MPTLKTLVEDALQGEIDLLNAIGEFSSGGAFSQTDLLTAEFRIQTIEEQLSELSENGFNGPLPWFSQDQVVDRMGTDFMAPVLRGVLTLGVSRGESLRLFWEDYFGWQDVTNTSRVWIDSPPPRPLLLLNICDSGRGSRFIFGVPPLPDQFFSKSPNPDPNIERQAVRCCGDVDPLPVVTLAHLVRLSSNFPWGFRVQKLGERNLIDGGVLDNTGIDSLYEVIRRLYFEPGGGGRRLLSKMAKKGVFILEVDSGGKPSINEETAQNAAWLLEPLHALGWAQHNNSEVVKTFYLREIEEMIQSSLEEELQPQLDRSLAESGSEEELPTIPRVVTSIRFQCENLDQSVLDPKNYKSVMTAWALNNQQKALVISRFMINLALFHAELESHRSELLKDLEDIWAIEQLETTNEQLATVMDLQQKLEEFRQHDQVNMEALTTEVERAHERIAGTRKTLSKNMWYRQEAPIDSDISTLELPSGVAVSNADPTDLSDRAVEETTRIRQETSEATQELTRRKSELQALVRRNLELRKSEPREKTLETTWREQESLSNAIQEALQKGSF